MSGLERLLHPPVFARVEREDGHASAWCEAGRQRVEQPLGRELRVHGNPLGAPGMEHGGMKQPYDTMAFTKGGAKTVYARHR